MSDMSQNLKIHIFGEEYSLVSDESHEHIEKAAMLVDAYMREIAEKGTLANEKKIAILGALRLASKLVQLESTIQQCNKKEQDLIAYLNQALVQ